MSEDKMAHVVWDTTQSWAHRTKRKFGAGACLPVWCEPEAMTPQQRAGVHHSCCTVVPSQGPGRGGSEKGQAWEPRALSHRLPAMGPGNVTEPLLVPTSVNSFKDQH